jgi:dienelactone hydrolase
MMRCMADVLLLHSVYGLRPAVLAAADRLRDGGHRVVTPDLYAGAVADTLEEGFALRNRIGTAVLMARAGEALGDLPSGGVLAGMSMGGAIAQELGIADPRVSGLLLLHGVGGVPEKVTAGLAVQVHTMNGDEFATAEEIAEWAGAMDRLGAHHEIFRYDGGGHLYTDADLPDYHGDSAELTWGRSLAFLASLTP